MRSLKFVLPLALLSICAFGEKQHQMEHGKVLSQNMDSSQSGTYNAPLFNGTVAVPIYRRSNLVVVETDHYRLEWSEVGNKTIILPVNGTIEFYRDGDWFIVQDSKHKKHKFALVGMTQKTEPAK